MADTVSKIKAELNQNAFIDKTFPMLTGWGVKDEDVLVHSLGCSVWNTLGHQLGFMVLLSRHLRHLVQVMIFVQILFGSHTRLNHQK